jgi:hypothetical protein
MSSIYLLPEIQKCSLANLTYTKLAALPSSKKPKYEGVKVKSFEIAMIYKRVIRRRDCVLFPGLLL